MRQLTKTEGLHVGDVVLVHQQCKDKQTGKPYTWRWFGLVTKVGKIFTLRVARMGAPAEEKNRALDLHITADRCKVFLLEEDEWPDGIWVFRTKAIMEGTIDIT